MSVINTDAQQGLKADVYIENLSHHAQLKCMTECLESPCMLQIMIHQFIVLLKVVYN